MDGNGRMGRLWQTLLLLKEYPVFEFLPFETLISKNQKAHYKALSLSDNQGKSTIFIEYMLGVLDKALEKLLDYNNRALKDIERLEYFISHEKSEFSRKDYMNLFKEISPATASRDLKKGVDNELLKKRGDKTKTIYKVIKK
jgi:Fic family protein